MGLTPFTTGSGRPVTIAAHGLGETVAQTRVLLSGVPGTRVFPVVRDPLPAGYGELAADLRAAADRCGATQALGASLGAATLLRTLVETPDRWDRLVLFLPAAFDRPRADLPEALAGLTDPPVPDPRRLAEVTADVLVLAQEGDPLHPAQVARDVAAALPRAHLVVFDQPGVLRRERLRFRSLVVGHLTAPDGAGESAPLGG